MTLLEVIQQAEKEHKGGEAYFNLIDKHVKHSGELLSWLLHSDAYIVVSTGEISRIFREECNHLPLVTFPYLGRANTDKYHESLLNDQARVCLAAARHSYIYIDDSIYSGKVRERAINLLSCGINTKTMTYYETRVIYDGMIERDPRVTSLYRYHP